MSSSPLPASSSVATNKSPEPNAPSNACNSDLVDEAAVAASITKSSSSFEGKSEWNKGNSITLDSKPEKCVSSCDGSVTDGDGPSDPIRTAWTNDNFTPTDGSPGKGVSLYDATVTESDTFSRGTSKFQEDDNSLTVEDLEEVLIELNNYERLVTKDKKHPPIPSLLDSYLKFVAHAGCTHFPWTKIKWLFRAKLEQVITEFFESFPLDEIPPTPNVDGFNFVSVKDKVFAQLESFAGIPFTVQRIAELLVAPKRHYRRTDKFMRALEKNMLIVSTIEPRPPKAAAPSDELLVNGNHSDRPAPRTVRPSSCAAIGSCNPHLGLIIRPDKESLGGGAPNAKLTSNQLLNANSVPSLSNSGQVCDSSDSVKENEKTTTREKMTVDGDEAPCSTRPKHRTSQGEETADQEVSESSVLATGVSSGGTEPVGVPSVSAGTKDNAVQRPSVTEGESTTTDPTQSSGQSASMSENGDVERPEADIGKQVDTASNQESLHGSCEKDQAPESSTGEKEACDSPGKVSAENLGSLVIDSKVVAGSEGSEAKSSADPREEIAPATSTVNKETKMDNVAAEEMEVDSECSSTNSRILQPDETPDV